ncbi:GntR family transcriptional regulator [Nocardia sp. alder85J]|uniref:GntR family transcriptional regulator n=1 Tax=Nocardia sp. alder85J TaxID=2862949 RepID=UPI001CD6C43F|nr:GntR family transcriptional regulator [Nocardia sp. alder85J]MCX4097996.1 GntR family transcriptional regulator [Nocardia sp. alder85J]
MTGRPLEVPTGRPLREFIHDRIRDRICDGTYPPGTRLVERDLAADFEVSRLPVREALRMLDTEGFVEMLATRGVIVRRLSRTDVEELFDVREALETMAFRRAAERATKGDIRKLEALVRKAERALRSGDRDTLYASNIEFHDLVPQMARNKVLVGMLEPIEGRLHWINLQNDEPETLWAEHRIMVDALISGSVELSQQLSHEHIAVNRARVLNHLFGTTRTRPDPEPRTSR